MACWKTGVFLREINKYRDLSVTLDRDSSITLDRNLLDILEIRQPPLIEICQIL